LVISESQNQIHAVFARATPVIVESSPGPRRKIHL
jgi:hypothetical protein